MGYRSEVVLAISKEMKPHFLTVLAQHESARRLVHDAEVFDKDYQEGGLLMAWGGVKWYDSYPEVAAIDKFVDDCESECLEGWDNEASGDYANSEYEHFRFVRIGEENDDIKESGNFAMDSIYVSRSVEF